MSTPTEDAWSPEPELRVPAPRRLQPSDFPDLNAPNAAIYRLAGVTGLALGVVLIFLGISQGPIFLILGVALLIAGAAAMILPPRKADQTRARAERLVREGQPIMARIVNSTNLTGDSAYGRTVSYMVTLPGGDLVRREVSADERALPKRIPANVTALMDFRTHEVELYCALPYRAVLTEAAAAAAAATADPLAAMTAGGGAPVAPAPGQPGAAGQPPQTLPQQPPLPPQQQTTSTGYQGLPWE